MAPLPRLGATGVLWSALLVGGVGACGSIDGASEDGAPRPSIGDQVVAGLDGPVMRHRDAESSHGEDAEIKGILEIDGGCLYVALDEVGERYPVVWPSSTVWDADARQVVLASGQVVKDGDRVYGGGGYHYVDDVQRVAGEAAVDVADRCVDNRYGEI
ncbi:MAG: hypothetical protein GY701_20590, partial [Sulfitobacter sp.]|nr:hypothetical protein [Sulfitobacter sp.]